MEARLIWDKASQITKEQGTRGDNKKHQRKCIWQEDLRLVL